MENILSSWLMLRAIEDIALCYLDTPGDEMGFDFREGYNELEMAMMSSDLYETLKRKLVPAVPFNSDLGRIYYRKIKWWR